MMNSSDFPKYFIVFLIIVFVVGSLAITILTLSLLSTTVQLEMIKEGVDPLVISCYDSFNVACSKLFSSSSL